MSLRATILGEFTRTAAEQEKPIAAALGDETVLLESGLDSLCFAIIVSRLEDDLGVDPFATAEDVTFPVTVGDFVRFYEQALR
jgi:acyl carrier protein